MSGGCWGPTWICWPTLRWKQRHESTRKSGGKMIFPPGRQTTWEEQVSSNGLQCMGADGAITNTSICEDAHFLPAEWNLHSMQWDIDPSTFLDALASLKTMFKIQWLTFSRFQDYRVLEIIRVFNRVLQSITECDRVLHSVTEYYGVL